LVVEVVLVRVVTAAVVSKSSCCDMLVSQMNNLALDSGLDNLWILTTTNMNIHEKTG
jgi:hypothetical protein